MDNAFDKSDFLSLFGFEAVWNNLNKSGYSTHAVIATNLEDGDIRSLLLRAKHMKNGEYRVRLKYLYHSQIDENEVDNVLELRFRIEDNQALISSAQVEGQDIDVHDPNKIFEISRAFKKFSDQIIKHNEWSNPIDVLESSGLITSGIGRRAWPGLYVTGDFKTSNSKTKSMNHEPVYPALFLPALLGVGRENYSGISENTRSLSIHGDKEEQESSIIKYRYKAGKTSKHMSVNGLISVHSPEGYKEENFYEIETNPHPDKKKHAVITKLKFMGKDIDLQSPEAISSALKVIRNTNRMIRAGDQALIEDLKKDPQDRRFALPTELALYTGLYEHLNEKVSIPQRGIMSFEAVGGNNTKKYLSDSDLYIGANEYFVSYEKTGRPVQAIGMDSGILFHEIFEGAFYNSAKYFHHKHDKSHKPEIELKAILYTHGHEDHLGKLAYLVKAGYQIPPILISEMDTRKLKRKMSELKIDKETREEILSLCFSIDLIKDVNPQNPEKRKAINIADTTIEQWTETVPGEKLGEFYYYPKLKIGDFTVRVGPMPHSSPGLMFDVITPAGSIRHTGDYKFDDTIRFGIPPLEPWLKAFKPDAMSADSSGVFNHAGNPKEEGVYKAIVEHLQADKDRRFILPMLGSNLARLTTTIAALGDANTKHKTLIIDGKAIEDLVRDADKAHKLKKWAKDTYGVKILYHTQKEARELVNDPQKNNQYAILVTGTQDEDFSSFARALRNWLKQDRYSITDKDVIGFLQGIIPTGDNKISRAETIEFLQLFHGAKVIDLPHSSGHNDVRGIIKMFELSGHPFILPIHGGPDHLNEHLKLANENGCEAMIVKDFSVRIDKGKKVSRYKITPSELVGINVFTPKDKWFLKGRHRETVLKIKPDLEISAANLMDVFERSVRRRAGITSKFEMANILPVSLSRTFNAQTVNGFLNQKMPFGIDKYKGDVFSEKNIYAIGGFDTETGGINANDHLIREFGLTIQDRDRQHIDSVQLFQSIPNYRMAGPQALLVTDTDPFDLENGLPAHEFVAQMNDAIKSVKKHSHSVAQEQSLHKVRKNSVKALMVAHNTKFDSRMIAKENARNLVSDTRPHQTRGTIALDTRTISRALTAYVPEKYKVSKKPGGIFDDHTLEALAKMLRVSYEAKQAHGGLYDTTLCLDVFWKQYDISPDIVGQLIINSDATTGHLLNDMMGVDTGFGGPHPVFSYVSPSAKRPKPQMGSIIGTLDSERYAVLFNLKYNPNEYLHLSEQEITSMLNDYDNEVFEVINLRQQPVIVPARYGLRVKANGSVPKETLDLRAGVIRRHLDYVDPKANWQTIAQKISNIWETNRSEIFKNRIARDYPDLDEKPSMMFQNAPTPDEGAIELLKMNAQIGFNLVYQHVHKNIREYLKHVRAGNFEAASENYKALIKKRKNLKSGVDVINNVHFDIRPQDLSKEDRTRVSAMRDLMAFKHYHQVLKQIQLIETDKEQYEKFIGKDENKHVLFEKIKKWSEKNKSLSALPDSAKLLLTPWAGLSRTDYVVSNDHAPDPSKVA